LIDRDERDLATLWRADSKEDSWLDKHMEAERTRNRSSIDALVALWAPGIIPTVERFEV
jgi:hypothetical protein